MYSDMYVSVIGCCITLYGDMDVSVIRCYCCVTSVLFFQNTVCICMYLNFFEDIPKQITFLVTALRI